MFTTTGDCGVAAGAGALVTADRDNRVIIRPRRDDRFVDLDPGQRC